MIDLEDVRAKTSLVVGFKQRKMVPKRPRPISSHNSYCLLTIEHILFSFLYLVMVN
ncbi:hypothetical protein Lalb_Chr02g0149141 [Lupinus albus]|uniref:Uncharacterized protein n=1 Tax=Lupinus albus TaxID=3870 RepID=A0A6A4QVZ6_LUPAL|nr:hypothetical protein Lalb_Chr02g0149141 [Lupinus albus]